MADGIMDIFMAIGKTHMDLTLYQFFIDTVPYNMTIESYGTINEQIEKLVELRDSIAKMTGTPEQSAAVAYLDFMIDRFNEIKAVMETRIATGE